MGFLDSKLASVSGGQYTVSTDKIQSGNMNVLGVTKHVQVMTRRCRIISNQ